MSLKDSSSENGIESDNDDNGPAVFECNLIGSDILKIGEFVLVKLPQKPRYSDVVYPRNNLS